MRQLLRQFGYREDGPNVRFGSWLCKNPSGKQAPPGAVAVRNVFPEFQFFRFGIAPNRSQPSWVVRHDRRPGIGGDYALIAAMSGWMPMMFMTRVRL